MKVPEVGKVYAFFDDGKLSESRQYAALVTRVIPIKSKWLKEHEIPGITLYDYEDYPELHSIKDYWKYAVRNHDWLFSKDTDYIIECAIPDFDEHLIYFARTKNDVWFSFDIETTWQAGELDVDGINDEHLKKDLKTKIKENKL